MASTPSQGRNHVLLVSTHGGAQTDLCCEDNGSHKGRTGGNRNGPFLQCCRESGIITSVIRAHGVTHLGGSRNGCLLSFGRIKREPAREGSRARIGGSTCAHEAPRPRASAPPAEPRRGSGGRRVGVREGKSGVRN